jgi:hypothetical protein
MTSTYGPELGVTAGRPNDRTWMVLGMLLAESVDGQHAGCSVSHRVANWPELAQACPRGT